MVPETNMVFGATARHGCDWRESITTERQQGESAEEDDAGLASSLADIDAILGRLEQGIAAEQLAMNRLLERLVSNTPQ